MTKEVDVAFYEYLAADWWQEYHRQRQIALAGIRKLVTSLNDIRDWAGIPEHVELWNLVDKEGNTKSVLYRREMYESR